MIFSTKKDHSIDTIRGQCDRLDVECPLLPVVQQLLADNQELLAENQAMKEQIKALEAQIKALKGSEDKASSPPEPPAFVKPNRKKRKRKPGRKKGHKGSGRHRPDHIDETIDNRLDKCPHCDHPLSDDDVVATREHVQEDIVPAQVKATLYRHHDYKCPCCDKEVSTTPTGDEIPKAKVGPRVLLVAALYKYEYRLPYRKIAQILSDSCGLTISAGGLAQGIQRLSDWMKDELDVILEAIRAGPSVNVDESGWRVDGINHWLWAFVNERYSYYRINRYRNSALPNEVLGNDYKGVVVSDFYSAYNPLPYEKQKCWVHMLRELRDVAKKNDSDEFLKFRKRLKRLYTDCTRLSKNRGTLSDEVFARRRDLLHVRITVLGTASYADADCQRLSGRLRKYGSELLTFLDHTDVDKDNNRAERAIRPNTVIRKISSGNRSEKGAEAHNTLMSVITTVIQRGKNWFDYGLRVIRNYRDGKKQTVLD